MAPFDDELTRPQMPSSDDTLSLSEDDAHLAAAMTRQNSLLSLLSSHSIDYSLHAHPPTPHCDDAASLLSHLDGIICRNLLVVDRRGAHFLIVAPHSSPPIALNSARIRKELGAHRAISFCAPNSLVSLFGIQSGSLSPLVLLEGHKSVHVTVALHIDLFDAEKPLLLHPMRCTASIAIKSQDLRFLLSSIGVPIVTVGKTDDVINDASSSSLASSSSSPNLESENIN